MTKKIFNLMIVALAMSSLFLTSCGDDDGPTTTKVYGTITIENTDLWQTWQDSGVVEVTIFPAFDLSIPAGWGAAPAGALGPGSPAMTIPLNAPYNANDPVIFTYVPGKNSYDYEIEVEPGTYSALALGLRHNLITDQTKRSATLGVYWGNENEVSHGIVLGPFNYPAPATIEVKAGEQKELNFKADFAFVNEWF